MPPHDPTTGERPPFEPEVGSLWRHNTKKRLAKVTEHLAYPSMTLIKYRYVERGEAQVRRGPSQMHQRKWFLNNFTKEPTDG